MNILSWRGASRSLAPWALGLGLFCLPLLTAPGAIPAWSEPNAITAPEGLSILQKACMRHAVIKTVHIKIEASLPNGWQEQSELWLDRSGRLNFHSKMTSTSAKEPLESHVWANGGKVVIWASQPNPEQQDLRNVYLRQECPPDLTALDGMARFGLAHFILRLLSGEPNRLAQAQLGEAGKLQFERRIKGIGADQIGLVSADGKQQDELDFDSDGLLKTVRGKSGGQVVASGNVTFVSINQPLEPACFDWKVPEGARELTK